MYPVDEILTVLLSAKPRARRNSPLPPTMLRSSGPVTPSTLPNSDSVLPLSSPAVNTKLMAVSADRSVRDELVARPCARPMSFELGSALSRRALSNTCMSPKVEEFLWRLATTMDVASGPRTVSWK
ncbi:unnamed protein product [Musa acuminata var. zebrina]